MSPCYPFVADQYKSCVITAKQVQEYVPLFITQEEADAITGE